jgi:hypothetical protein
MGEGGISMSLPKVHLCWREKVEPSPEHPFGEIVTPLRLDESTNKTVDFRVEIIARPSGRQLTLVASELYGLQRRLYEHIPWLGDRWLRGRCRKMWKPINKRTTP